MTTFDIKEIISGRDIFDNDNPDLENQDADMAEGDAARRHLEKVADYSDMSLEELLERMEKIAEQQKTSIKRNILRIV